MAYRNTNQTYGSIAKFFHWLISFLVIAMLIAGPFMGDLPNTPFKGQVYGIHKLTGIAILALIILRLLWTIANPKPLLPPAVPAWQAFSARALHWLFYIMLIAMPISGMVMSEAAGRPAALFGWTIGLPFIPESKEIVNNAKNAHITMMWIIWGLLILHIAAALKHHFVNKDNVLKKMLPGK